MLASVNSITPAFVAAVQLLLDCQGPQLLVIGFTFTPLKNKPQSLNPALISPAIVTPKFFLLALKPFAQLLHAVSGHVPPALGPVPSAMGLTAGCANAVYGCESRITRSEPGMKSAHVLTPWKPSCILI